MNAHHAMTGAVDEHESARARRVLIPSFRERVAAAWWSLASRCTRVVGQSDLADDLLLPSPFPHGVSTMGAIERCPRETKSASLVPFYFDFPSSTRMPRVAPEKAVFRPALAMRLQPGFPEKQMKMTYAEQLRHPYWQRKRLEALDAANFQCASCEDTQTTLNVHHKHYIRGRMAWEYEVRELEVLCESCHLLIHKDKAALDGELAALEHFEYAWLYDFLLGRRQALVSLIAPPEYVDAQLSCDEDSSRHAFFCGRLVSSFADLSAAEVANVFDAFHELDPAGFVKTLKDAMRPDEKPK